MNGAQSKLARFLRSRLRRSATGSSFRFEGFSYASDVNLLCLGNPKGLLVLTGASCLNTFFLKIFIASCDPPMSQVCLGSLFAVLTIPTDPNAPLPVVPLRSPLSGIQPRILGNSTHQECELAACRTIPTLEVDQLPSPLVAVESLREASRCRTRHGCRSFCCATTGDDVSGIGERTIDTAKATLEDKEAMWMHQRTAQQRRNTAKNEDSNKTLTNRSTFSWYFHCFVPGANCETAYGGSSRSAFFASAVASCVRVGGIVKVRERVDGWMSSASAITKVERRGDGKVECRKGKVMTVRALQLLCETPRCARYIVRQTV